MRNKEGFVSVLQYIIQRLLKGQYYNTKCLLS